MKLDRKLLVIEALIGFTEMRKFTSSYTKNYNRRMFPTSAQFMASTCSEE